MSTYEEIIKAAMSLPAGARVMLAEHLLESVDDDDQKRIDALWAEEIERRVKQIEDGTATLIPGEEVMNRLRARYSDERFLSRSGRERTRRNREAL